jgi:serine protease Do
MLSKPVKTSIVSFAAGAMLMGAFGLGVQNASYFKTDEATVSSGTAGTTSSQPQQSTSSSSINPVSLESNNSSVIANMVKMVGPSVVKIDTTQSVSSSPQSPFYQQFFGGNGQGQQTQQALGSGFIISKDGYILTNHHVIEGAQTIKVTITGNSNPYDAKVIGDDPDLDLAVLKISTNKDLPYLSLGDSDQTQVGDWAVAIGNPYGLDHTVTVGLISAKGRPLDIGQTHFSNLLQTDASINPGNSGGPLLNLRGQVVGINTAIDAEAQGIGFAIPINTVKSVLNDLIQKGGVPHPWLGVALQDMTPQLAEDLNSPQTKGAVVDSVIQGSPADLAGLQEGDVIVQMDKQEITTSAQLANMISAVKVGQKHELLISRNGQLTPITVVIQDKNKEQNSNNN